MALDQKFKQTQEQKLRDAAKRPRAKEATSAMIAPDQLTVMPSFLQVKSSIESAKNSLSKPLDQAFEAGYSVIARTSGADSAQGRNFPVPVVIKTTPRYSATSYYSSLENEWDYYRYLRLLKLWMAAGTPLSNISGSAWWASKNPAAVEKVLLAKSPYSSGSWFTDPDTGTRYRIREVREVDAIKRGISRSDISTKSARFHYATAIRRFPEVLIYHVMSAAMMLAKASKYTDEPSLNVLYKFAVNRLDQDIEKTASMISSPELVRMSVDGIYIADVPSAIPDFITVSPEIVPWLPRATTPRRAILYAINQTRWLLLAQIEKLGAQVVALSTPGTQAARHPSLTDSSENIYLVYNPVESGNRGETTFTDVSVQQANLLGPRNITVDRSDPRQAWVPRPADFTAEKLLRSDVKRTIPVQGGTTLSREEARQLGLPVPDEKGSVIPWAIAGVAAAAIATQVL